MLHNDQISIVLDHAETTLSAVDSKSAAFQCTAILVLGMLQSLTLLSDSTYQKRQIERARTKVYKRIDSSRAPS